MKNPIMDAFGKFSILAIILAIIVAIPYIIYIVVRGICILWMNRSRKKSEKNLEFKTGFRNEEREKEKERAEREFREKLERERRRKEEEKEYL